MLNDIHVSRHVGLICRVGIDLPTIEVRYENLSIEADCYVGDRALPSNWNTARNFVEVSPTVVVSGKPCRREYERYASVAANC